MQSRNCASPFFSPTCQARVYKFYNIGAIPLFLFRFFPLLPLVPFLPFVPLLLPSPSPSLILRTQQVPAQVPAQVRQFCHIRTPELSQAQRHSLLPPEAYRELRLSLVTRGPERSRYLQVSLVCTDQISIADSRSGWARMGKKLRAPDQDGCARARTHAGRNKCLKKCQNGC